ncbi:MAG TPA: hypothetical protein VFO01_12640 [Trebonia sp.]|nr:hypothetical protein [Trebonia sp.]
MTSWDAAEGARFTDRVQPAVIEANTALVQLSLMSPGLQQAATRVSEAPAATGNARKPRDVKAAGKQPGDAIAGLRAAVVEYTSRKPRHWRRRPLPAAGSRVTGNRA